MGERFKAPGGGGVDTCRPVRRQQQHSHLFPSSCTTHACMTSATEPVSPETCEAGIWSHGYVPWSGLRSRGTRMWHVAEGHGRGNRAVPISRRGGDGD